VFSSERHTYKNKLSLADFLYFTYVNTINSMDSSLQSAVLMMDPPQSDVFLLYILSKETQRKARFKTRIYSVSTVILYFCGLSFGYENTLGMCYEILYPDISVSVQNPA